MKLFSKQSLGIIITDVLVWSSAMLFYSLLRFSALSSIPWVSLSDGFDYEMVMFLTFETGVILGLIYGIVDVFLDQQWMRRQAFGKALLIKGVIHLFIIVVMSISIRVRAFEFMGLEVTPENMKNALLNTTLLMIFLYTTIISFILNFFRQINEKFGPGNLWKFLTGKFHRPQEEHRIFMFLDLRSSTTIAEKLGHIKFSQLLQDCFQDLAVVWARKAEVYQYVGDEVVLTWESSIGLNNCNCLMAFKDFQKQLSKKGDHYLSRYGVNPEFKAGLNLGKVTVAEIGSIKREIAFHGDTLNTAARIQDQCNAYKQDVLISESLHSKLPECNGVLRKNMGPFNLKGKQDATNIYSVEFKN